MRTKRFLLLVRISLAIVSPWLQVNAYSGSHILESFTVTTQHVQIREFTESSIHLKADTSTYLIKLEPVRAGKVIFSLSGIGYTSTMKFTNLLFGVRITGYREDRVIYPAFSIDDVNRDIILDDHMLIFTRIYGALPVWFDEQVDSITLQFSNSHSINMSQFLGIRDLRIIPPSEISRNPELNTCRPNTVMIALDGSSSIDKDERTLIGAQLLEFSRRSGFARDSHQLFITEFGTHVFSSDEATDRRAAIEAMKKYKRDKNHKSKFTSWTNWSAVLDEALRHNPDLLILITDGWSNWTAQGSASFSAQYENLVQKCNQLKANGTRLLFITSEIDMQQNSVVILRNLLNGESTRELKDADISPDVSLKDVDLISLAGFTTLESANLSSILHCHIELPPIPRPEMHVALAQSW